MASEPKQKPSRRPAGRLPSISQVELPLGSTAVERPGRTTQDGRVVDVVAARHAPEDMSPLLIGNVPVARYLEERELGWIVRLDELLGELDYTPFFRKMSARGRSPIHPRRLVGLVVYGALVGKQSLRELEALAALDVGAWVICNRLQPDHSTIGKFIVASGEILSREFFVETTRRLVAKLRLSNGTAAIDGTVIESAASRFSLVRAQAAEEHAQQARELAAASPADTAAKKNAEDAARVVQAIEERTAERIVGRRNTRTVAASRTDPDAVVQPRKDGPMRPAYRPSIIANEEKLITAQVVERSSENAAVAPLLDQHRETVGAAPRTLVADGLYATTDILKTCVERDIDVLVRVESSAPKKDTALFDKSEFTYDEERDAYRCPAGRLVVLHQHHRDEHGRALKVYLGRECGGCPQRSSCTRSPRGRIIKRYDGEEMKEHLARIVQHPDARAKLARRKVIVEPVYADIKTRQRFHRFRRRGLALVRVEFALQCLAYNLRRAMSLAAAIAAIAASWRLWRSGTRPLDPSPAWVL